MGGLVSKHMTVTLSVTIETIREDGLSPTYSLHQIRMRGFDAKMIMVPH